MLPGTVVLSVVHSSAQRTVELPVLAKITLRPEFPGTQTMPYSSA